MRLLAAPSWNGEQTQFPQKVLMKDLILGIALLVPCSFGLQGCSDKREMIGPGTAQYDSMKQQEQQMAAIRSGKPVTLHLPASSKPPPGKEGTPPPPNVTIVYDGK